MFNYCLLSADGKTIAATGQLEEPITEFEGQAVIENDGTMRAGFILDETTGKFKAPEVANKTPAELQQIEYEKAVQAHLDKTAQNYGYENILSACSYAGEINPFQAEGKAFTAWRGNVWAYCYSVLSDVEAGTRTAPTLSELIQELPAYVAP